ncbi:MAG: molybdopterin-synthase adenylyltransferase MoeB [Euryarchaeota archaeon]|nr:molybdopterin-synthase adenylyltransferase MoeB [Euryarchaeota archaeon]
MAMVDMERHARHLVLPNVGLEGQEKLASARVLVIGAGGLGSPVLLYLAAAGIGTIGIVDDDVVDISNLQRQIIHRTEDVGLKKVDSARARLLALDPNIKVEVYPNRLNPENALNVLKGWDVVVDGTDNIPTRYLIDDACHLLSIPWVYGSIHRFEGQVSVFSTEQSRCYRDLFPEAPPAGALQNCADAGVFGVLPGVVGSIQATEVIKRILGLETNLVGALLLYDALEMSTRMLRFEALESRQKIDDLSLVQQLFDDPIYCMPSNKQIDEGTLDGRNMMQSIDVASVKAKQSEGWKPFIIDVRSAEELDQIRLNSFDLHAVHDVISSHSNEVPEEGDIVVICRSGMRSQMAIMFLTQAGIDANRLYNLDGGIMAWSQIAPEDVIRG